MAFHPDTKIYTLYGWKKLTDIRGTDRVLVRNFIGDAEFIQPFALRKKHYAGEMVTIGSSYWATTTTPDHKIVYENKPATVAGLVKKGGRAFLSRKFHYLREDKNNEIIYIYTDGVAHSRAISDEDWYTIVAYTMTRGYLSKGRKPRLQYSLSDEKALPLIAIFEKIGISWGVTYQGDNQIIIVNGNNNLARKLKTYLGARARRDMRLPHKMLYGSSQPLLAHFIRTIEFVVGRRYSQRPNNVKIATQNADFAENLRTVCLLAGFGYSNTFASDIYIIDIIDKMMSSWSVIFIEKKYYEGPVYEIDLFDGLVYVTERNLPVWMSPK